MEAAQQILLRRHGTDVQRRNYGRRAVLGQPDSNASIHSCCGFATGCQQRQDGPQVLWSLETMLLLLLLLPLPLPHASC